MPETENDYVHGLVAGFVHPTVGFEPAESFDDALLDRELRFPSGGLHFLGFEKDKRIVSDPTTVATCIFEGRFQTERGANVADTLVDLNVFRRAEIVDLGMMGGVTRGVGAGDMEHRVDTVLHVEVTLALFTVT